MPFLKHPVTKITLFVGQKDYDKHMAAVKDQEEAKKRHDAEAARIAKEADRAKKPLRKNS